MANEFLVQRVIATNIPVPSNTVSTWVSTPVYVPAGAIITGVTLNCTGAPTVAAAGSNTIALYVSTDIQLISATALTDITSVAAQTQPWPGLLMTAAGVYISKGGPLYMAQGVSDGTASWTYSPDVYVGYLKS